MPPKRQAPTNIDDHSPPPAQRLAIAAEHHLSPRAGHQQEIPEDAPVAISTPPRAPHHAIDMQPPLAITAENTDPNMAAQISPAQQGASPMVPATIAATNGGARAAFAAIQQLRVITCNLASIPASACCHNNMHHKDRASDNILQVHCSKKFASQESSLSCTPQIQDHQLACTCWSRTKTA